MSSRVLTPHRSAAKCTPEAEEEVVEEAVVEKVAPVHVQHLRDHEGDNPQEDGDHRGSTASTEEGNQRQQQQQRDERKTTGGTDDGRHDQRRTDTGDKAATANSTQAETGRKPQPNQTQNTAKPNQAKPTRAKPN